MGISPVRLLSICLCFCFFALAQAQQDNKPWEKYGLSQSEWKKITDNDISIKKLEELLSSGIDVNDYIKKPWIKLKLGEQEWIDKRRAGMSNYDIELEMQSDRTGYKTDTRNSLKAENNLSGTGGLFRSFFFPGYEQTKMGHKTKGTIMSGLAIGAFVGTAVWSIHKNQLDPIPLIAILVPDMLWSVVDYKVTVSDREQ